MNEKNCEYKMNECKKDEKKIMQEYDLTKWVYIPNGINSQRQCDDLEIKWKKKNYFLNIFEI